MKAVIQDNADRVPPFPKLMKHSHHELVVLMTETGVGTVVYRTVDSEAPRLGKHSCSWVMENFENFGGQVLLEND